MPLPIMIASLHLYPLKGCRAVDVASIKVSPDGLLVGDRTAMIVDAATGRFISQRHEPRLARLLARTTIDTATVELSMPGRETISFRRSDASATVTVWDDTFDADDGGDAAARWLSNILGRPVRLAWLRVGEREIDPYWTPREGMTTTFADLAPALVTNAASLDALNDRREAAGRAAIPMSRFRPNIVVSGLAPFAEDETEALESLDGRLTIRLIKPCARCDVTELEPTTGDAAGDEVLRSLAEFRTLRNRRGTRGIMFGQNAILETSGPASLRVGDRLRAVPRIP